MVMIEPTVTYDVKLQGGVAKSLFGGEGLFLVHMTGPGHVTLQTLPFSRTARRVLAAAGADATKSAGAVSSAASPANRRAQMGFLDKAKQAAEQATAKAKEGVEDVQVKRELSQTYNELGKVAFELVESNEITHPQLEALAEKIRGLNARDRGDETLAGAAAG